MVVRVLPPEGGESNLTVEDAMQQVLDTFKLLSAGTDTVVWRLVSASTNSPFTVVAEAQESAEAALQKAVFAQSMRELKEGRYPEAWKRPDLQDVSESLLRRTTEHVTRLEFTFSEEAGPIVLLPEDAAPFAEPSLLTISPALAPIPVPKSQVGSIEGVLVEVITYRDRPAIRIRERKTGREITCVIASEIAAQFSSTASMQDVWGHRRLTVRGMVVYGASHTILRIEASSIEPAERISLPLPSLKDPSFTGGLSAAEYLERFRAGELG